MDATEFIWTVPKIHRVRAWVMAKLGWTDAEVDTKITPVILKFANRNPHVEAATTIATFDHREAHLYQRF